MCAAVINGFDSSFSPAANPAEVVEPTARDVTSTSCTVQDMDEAKKSAAESVVRFPTPRFAPGNARARSYDNPNGSAGSAENDLIFYTCHKNLALLTSMRFIFLSRLGLRRFIALLCALIVTPRSVLNRGSNTANLYNHAVAVGLCEQYALYVQIFSDRLSSTAVQFQLTMRPTYPCLGLAVITVYVWIAGPHNIPSNTSLSRPSILLDVPCFLRNSSAVLVRLFHILFSGRFHSFRCQFLGLAGDGGRCRIFCHSFI